MDVLHLSDLHVVEPGQTLDTVWTGVPPALQQRRFDAIVVSGDLTQRADRSEYEALSSFCERSLLPLLASGKQDRRRIIFVPGNHDVSWPISERAFAPLPFPIEPRQLEQYRRNPDYSPLRMRWDRDGSAQWLIRQSDDVYATRFLEFQRFTNSFYGKVNDTDKHFDLLDKHGGQQWSAHVFSDERMAFYGFNSCHANDCYWHGAPHHAPRDRAGASAR